MTSSKYKTFFLSLFEYYTPKIVLIKNVKIGILNRIVQLAIICYIIGYVIIYNKGYQDFSPVESSVTTKVKGIAYTNYSNSEFDPRIPDIEVYQRIWDAADYIVPPSENNAFFVITNILITANQTLKECPEDPDVSKCTSNTDCKRGTAVINGNGVFTGECVTSDQNSTAKVCEISGWCPVERDVNPLKNNKALLSSTKKFTVLIKNFVDFPKYKIRRRNIPDYYDDKYLKHCTFHPVNNPLCPIFVLEDIVPGNYEEIAVKGASIAIVIDWQCDFDYSESKCYPKYSFRRLDENSPISPGLNFRYAHNYGDSERTLYKAYGIKFILMAQGRGGKFSVVPLFLNIGSGLGLLVVATLLCDIVVLYIVKKKYFYKSVKFQNVIEESENNNPASNKYIGGEY